MALKDKWEKLDIFTKFFNGVILAVLIFIVKISSDKITYSMQYGDMVQKTIADLSSTSDNKIRRDLSLITLNRTIGDNNPRMLSELAELVYLNDTVEEFERNTAFKIIKERDPEKALYYENKIMEEINATRTDILSTSSNMINDTTFTSNHEITTKPVNKSLKQLQGKIRVSLENIVYLQVVINDNTISSISDNLNDIGYKVPSVELVKGDFNNCVKYFHSMDVKRAHEIANIIEKNMSTRIKIVKVDDVNNNIPTGQIEVWINNGK